MKPKPRHKGKVHRQLHGQQAGKTAPSPEEAAVTRLEKEAECSGCGHDHHHDHHGHEHAHSHSHDGPEAVHQQAGEMTVVAPVEGESEWTRRFFLFLELGVLMLWALVMIWFYTSGRIEKYLIGEGLFRIQVLIAGLVLPVMGLFNWFMRAQNAGCAHDHSHEHGAEDEEAGCCGHDHTHAHEDGIAHAHDHHHEEAHSHSHSHSGTFGGRSIALILLAFSVTAAAALTADDFSNAYKMKMVTAESGRGAPQGETPDQYRMAPEKSEQVSAGGVTLELIEKYQKRNARGNFDLDVMQLYYSGSDAEYAKVMKGQGVETIGQVVRDPAANDPRKLRVFVLQVSCCAADARPFSIPVEVTAASLPEIQDMGWYKIAGKVDYIQERGVMTAVLKADDIQATVRPRNQKMLF